MKVLVTGATGFIGNYIINELLSNNNSNNIEIIATSRDVNKAKSCNWFSKVKYIPYDIDNVLDDDIDLFNFFNCPDSLIHLSWDGLSDYNDLIHIEKNLYNNYFFIKNLILNGLKDVTITGTCLEYGKIDGELSESMNTNPSTCYAIAKDSLRNFIEELSKNYVFSFKWVRLFYVYGKGQSSKSLISQLEQAIANQEKEFNMSGGEQLRDYLPVENVAFNICKIAMQNDICGIINCCSGKPISIRKFIENYLKNKQYKMKLNFGVYPYPDYEAMAFWGNNKKLKDIINMGDKSE